jgi:hypothetical protein
MSGTLDAALEYAGSGQRVLPLDGKRPHFEDWPNRASRDRATVLGWWRQWPEANVGLLCGDGLLVLDVDGDAARHELDRLQALHGPLPRTATVATGRDGYGRHLHFTAPRGARSWKLWRDEDGHELAVKASGQVVAPPSVHPDTGRQYVWLDCPGLAVAPVWLLQRPARPVPSPAPGTRSDDPLRRIPAPVYVPLLTGRALGYDGKVRCPLHAGGEERTPSLHAYDGDGGWYCYGCERGGTIIDLAAALWGLGTRGEDYCELRRRVVQLVLAEAAA